MKQLLFCAKDIRDYLEVMTDMSEFYLPDFDPKFPPLNDAPAIQQVLHDILDLYDDLDICSSAPICGETGIDGLRLDFNFGLRLEVPEGNFHVRIGDVDSEQIFFDRDISDVRLLSVEKYFIRWHVEVFRDGEKVFDHVINLAGQPVLVAFKKFAPLGDTIAYLRTLSEFERRSGCEMTVFMPKYLRELVAHLYPGFKLVDEVTFDNYATFYLSWLASTFPMLPADARMVPLERLPENVFGMKLSPTKATFTPTAPPVTNEPYVCIAVQASMIKKGWLYPNGWDIVVDYLKSLGYRVFCIDKDSSQSNNGLTIQKPDGAEDFTGDLPLMHRANMLYHAEFFIGLSSGLAWLADAVNCPVVMICGFSQDWSEFDTPYRVANRLVCNGCINDIDYKALRFFIRRRCPHHDGTVREFECQKKITPRQVINAIERLLVDENLTPPILR